MRENPIRIALFISSLAGGGAERVMLEVARGLIRHGLSVDFLISRSGPFLDLVPKDARLINFNSWITMTSLPQYFRYLRRERPAVVISSTNSCNVLALLGKRMLAPDLPVIVRYENTLSMAARDFNLRQRMVMRAMMYLLPSANAVISVSSGAAEDLKKMVPKAAHLVHSISCPAVKTEQISKAAEQPVEHPWFGDSGVPVVLAAGRLSPQKDYVTLLRAFAEVVKLRPARLLILGEGPERKRLTKLIHELGLGERVALPGFQANLFAYMSKARVFALSSRYEGLPVVLVEAMACGTPVVSTDCPNGPREVLEEGKWGRLVGVGDWRALAEGILETLDRPVSAEALKARAKFYSAESAVENHLAIMREVGVRFS